MAREVGFMVWEGGKDGEEARESEESFFRGIIKVVGYFSRWHGPALNNQNLLIQEKLRFCLIAQREMLRVLSHEFSLIVLII